MTDQFDLLLLGMGAAGMAAAEFARGLGLRVGAVERARVGGDTVWTGAVPSKALLASARAAHVIRHASELGVEASLSPIDTAVVWRRVRAVRDELATTDDDPARFEDMGLELVHGTARVIGPELVEVVEPSGSTRELGARFLLVATGSHPAAPDLAGLDQVGALDTTSLFELDRAPDSIAILGGGPTGVELAQALCRLGVRVTLLEREARVLNRDEPVLVSLLQQVLVDEGVDLVVGVDVQSVARGDAGTIVRGIHDGEERSWTVERLLVATGRRPNVDGLGLEEVGVVVGPEGIEVDERLRTHVPSIYAVGDVAGRNLFTHAAGYESVRAVRDMFLPGKGRANELVPWCTFTDPELAHVGVTIGEAEDRYGDDVQVWRQDLVHADRARADGMTTGSIIIVTNKGRIVGAHLLAPTAGEMIHELSLAIREGLSLSSLGGLPHVYPTYATGIHQVAAGAASERAESFRWLVKKGRRSSGITPGG